MKKLLLLTVLLATTCFSFSQNYSIGHRQVTWSDGNRSNRQVTAEVFYPADAAGDNVPLPEGNKKFAVVAFAHGFLLNYQDYKWLYDSLVPQGYFVIFPRTEENILPNQLNLAQDLAFIVNHVNQESNDAASWLYSRILGRYAAGGHSLGGGCAILAIQFSPLINALFSFGAAETNPSAISAAQYVTVPSLLFGGSADCITPPGTTQIPMYNNMQGCKNFVEITGARHCHWALNDGLCIVGEFFSCGLATNYTQTLAITSALLTPWLRGVLYHKRELPVRFNRLVQTDIGFTHLQQCTLTAANKLLQNKLVNFSIKIYPVPVQSGKEVMVVLPFKTNQQFAVRITNQAGVSIQTVQQSSTDGQMRINTKGLSTGVHYILVQHNGQAFRGSFMVVP